MEEDSRGTASQAVRVGRVQVPYLNGLLGMRHLCANQRRERCCLYGTCQQGAGANFGESSSVFSLHRGTLDTLCVPDRER